MDAASLPAAGHPVSFSALALFLQADIVVKCVMIGLVLASVWSWAIMIDKGMRLGRLKARAQAFEAAFWSNTTFEKLYDANKGEQHPYAQVFVAGMDEWRRSAGRARTDREALSARVTSAMRVAFEREMDRLEHRLTFLATVASAAPFVGLFGTVWGIMRSFTAIAQTQNTTLAVVAPGIAEALFATAIGLAAAIPALIGYNKLQAEVGRYGSRLSNFCDEFQTLFSRQLDERAA